MKPHDFNEISRYFIGMRITKRLFGNILLAVWKIISKKRTWHFLTICDKCTACSMWSWHCHSQSWSISVQVLNIIACSLCSTDVVALSCRHVLLSLENIWLPCFVLNEMKCFTNWVYTQMYISYPVRMYPLQTCRFEGRRIHTTGCIWVESFRQVANCKNTVFRHGRT